MTGIEAGNKPPPKVPIEEAKERLVVNHGAVHTFVNPSLGMLIGADWDVEDAIKLMEKHGVEEAGPMARATGHCLVVTDLDHKPPRHVFFEASGGPLP